MTKINTYEGNSFRVTRTFTTSTTLAAYGVTFTMMQNKDDYTPLVSVTGVVTGQGVIFDIPPQTLSKGVYYFEITAETATQKVTLEQDRVIMRESIKYVS
jgi:phage shock protein PspC (stress-responsive transcriptional regulator)